MLTDDPVRFMETLRPGDLLLFDKLQHAGALIQFADNAPCSHCAIVVDATHAADATLPGPDRDSVAITPILELLDHSYLHGVLALRLPGAEAHAARIREAVAGFIERGAEFEMLDLLALAPSALLRAYHDQKFGFGPVGWKLLCRALEVAAGGLDQLRRDCSHKLTCSEFVYRVYAAAGLEITVLEPLPWRPERGYFAPREREIAFTAEEIEDHISPGHPGCADTTVDPNLVTPGDLYRSPSFEIAARWVAPHPYRG